MGRLSLWPAVLGLALAMIVVTILVPVPNSLGFASAVVVLISLLGWIMEARQVAGPPPAVEPEHEEEEEAPGPSYWPVFLAIGIVGIAAGIVYDWEYGALVVALPMAAGAAAAWGKVIQQEMAPHAAGHEPLSAPAMVTSGGRVLAPVAPGVLASQAAGGAAIAIELTGAQAVSRRTVVRLAFWTGLGAGLAAIGGAVIDFLYPRGITGFGGVVNVTGTTATYPPGTKTAFPEGRFWLVSLTPEQGGPGFLALWWKCPHLGCTVPWRSTFSFVDPSGSTTQGWFRCPCHGSTYDNAGVRVFGPAPRSMDRMELKIDPGSGRISVNTGKTTKGTPDNAKFAVKS